MRPCAAKSSSIICLRMRVVKMRSMTMRLQLMFVTALKMERITLPRITRYTVELQWQQSNVMV